MESRALMRLGVRLAIRGIHSVMLLALLCMSFVVFGLLPVNGDFVPADDGIEIVVTSSEVHADIVVPLTNEVQDWREFLPEDSIASGIESTKYVAFGWGDKGFYINTPTWADLKVSTTLNAAVLPSSCCMHVECLQSADSVKSRGKSVRVTQEQYGRLVEFIKSSFKRDKRGAVISIDGAAYWNNDAFFEATGTYMAFNTCNSWVGRALKTTGVRTGIATPLPGTVLWYLPN